MIKKYISKYTGPQIDEAVHAIVENDITMDDLSPELIQTIKDWGGGEVSLTLAAFDELPEVGEENRLYFATDRKAIYIWDTTKNQYIPLIEDSKDYQEINGGGASSW